MNVRNAVRNWFKVNNGHLFCTIEHFTLVLLVITFIR